MKRGDWGQCSATYASGGTQTRSFEVTQSNKTCGGGTQNRRDPYLLGVDEGTKPHLQVVFTIAYFV